MTTWSTKNWMEYLFVAPLLALLPISGCATEAIPFGHEAPWEERQYKTTLPAPFGEVQLTIAADGRGKTTAFLFAGSDKSDQQAAIDAAKGYLADYKARKPKAVARHTKGGLPPSKRHKRINKK